MTKKKAERSIRNGIFFALLFGLCACASNEKKTACLSEAEEPISVCRAREKCERESSNVGVGLGVGFGHFGMGVGRTHSSQRYENCLEEDLNEQQKKLKSKPAEPSTNTPPSSTFLDFDTDSLEPDSRQPTFLCDIRS